jgi:hypothetical protein
MKHDLEQLCVCPVNKAEEFLYRELMQQHHYLGDLAKIGHTLWYMLPPMARSGRHTGFFHLCLEVRCAWPLDRMGFSSPIWSLELNCQQQPLSVLPKWHYPNLGSKALYFCHRRIAEDWQAHFGQPLLLLETFVDPSRFHGTVYRAVIGLALGW